MPIFQFRWREAKAVPIRVLIVDDQRLMREGLKTILELEEDIEITGLAENGRDALDRLGSAKPDVVLMDIRMPVMDGVECTGIIRQSYPDVRVLILTTFDDDEYIIDGLKNGAAGYLLKDMPSEKLVNAIRDVYSGVSIMQPEIAVKLVSHIIGIRQPTAKDTISSKGNEIDELTDREKEILGLVAKGLNNREIAKTLFISEGTVKNYISSIYDKTGINERSRLVIYAIEKKFI